MKQRSLIVRGGGSSSAIGLVACYPHFHPSVLEDDVPVQPVGQVQGAVQPSQQHLQQPVPAGHLLPPEEVPLALHPQSRWLPFVWRLT